MTHRMTSPHPVLRHTQRKHLKRNNLQLDRDETLFDYDVIVCDVCSTIISVIVIEVLKQKNKIEKQKLLDSQS